MYTLDPPELKDTPEAPVMAAEKLKEMGPLSANEGKMVAGLGITVVLWIFGAQLGVSAALAAMIGRAGGGVIQHSQPRLERKNIRLLSHMFIFFVYPFT